MVGFAGKRTIKNTIRLELPEGFQTSEFLLKHGSLTGSSTAGPPHRSGSHDRLLSDPVTDRAVSWPVPHRTDRSSPVRDPFAICTRFQGRASRGCVQFSVRQKGKREFPERPQADQRREAIRTERPNRPGEHVEGLPCLR